MKLTDHLLALVPHVEKYAQEAQNIGAFGMGMLSFIVATLHGVSGMLQHSPFTIPVPGTPVSPPQA
jgi:hypothetical protein